MDEELTKRNNKTILIIIQMGRDRFYELNKASTVYKKPQSYRTILNKNKINLLVLNFDLHLCSNE